jgi:predicted transposase/invertase (TIGR01784 family)
VVDMEKSEDTKETIEMINKARKVLEDISADEHERYLAELRLKYIMDQKAIEDAGYDKGLEAGIRQGELNTKLKIAKKLKNQNIDIEIISKTTGLSIEEIKDLKD